MSCWQSNYTSIKRNALFTNFSIFIIKIIINLNWETGKYKDGKNIKLITHLFITGDCHVFVAMHTARRKQAK